VAVALAVGLAHAQERKVSVVVSRSITPYLEALAGVQEALQSAGVHSTVDVHDIKGDRPEGVRVASELTKRKPELIVTVGTEATQVVSEHTTHTPIVFSMVVHAETLIAGDKPLVGASMEVPPLEQLRLLRALLPNARRVGLIYNPARHLPLAIERRREAARQLGLELAVEVANDVTEIPLRLRTLLPTIDAFWLIPDETTLAPEMVRHIMLETLRVRVPVLAPSWAFMEEGALLAVACDYRDVGRQAGEWAVQLLTRQPLGPTRVVEARTIRLYLNLRIAKTLGIEVPASLIAKADRFIR
jgi:putative ABC transport system substrate-binding protein